MRLGVNTAIVVSISHAPIARYIRPLETDMSDIRSPAEALTSYGHSHQSLQINPSNAEHSPEIDVWCELALNEVLVFHCGIMQGHGRV